MAACSLSARTTAHGSGARPEHHGSLEWLGLHLLGVTARAGAVLAFIGDIAIAFWRVATGRARMRGRDLVFQLEQCGAHAVGIVTLVCFLVGAISPPPASTSPMRATADFRAADPLPATATADEGAASLSRLLVKMTAALATSAK